jgi:hypothetical protein
MPKRVLDRSEMSPTRGSLIASQRMTTKAAPEARKGFSPTASVMKMAQKNMRRVLKLALPKSPPP